MNVNFPWKRRILSLNYFARAFQEFLPQIKKQILCRTYVLQNSHFWAKLPLAVCGTFLFSKFVCIWLLILRARIQFLKESRVAAMESFSNELVKVIVHKSSKKRSFWNIGGTYKKNTHSEIQLQIIGYNLANIPADIKTKNCLWKLCIWLPGRSYVFLLQVHFMFFFRLEWS